MLRSRNLDHKKTEDTVTIELTQSQLDKIKHLIRYSR